MEKHRFHRVSKYTKNTVSTVSTAPINTLKRPLFGPKISPKSKDFTCTCSWLDFLRVRVRKGGVGYDIFFLHRL